MREGRRKGGGFKEIKMQGRIKFYTGVAGKSRFVAAEH